MLTTSVHSRQSLTQANACLPSTFQPVACFAGVGGCQYHPSIAICGPIVHIVEGCESQKLCIHAPWHGHPWIPWLCHVDRCALTLFCCQATHASLSCRPGATLHAVRQMIPCFITHCYELSLNSNKTVCGMVLHLNHVLNLLIWTCCSFVCTLAASEPLVYTPLAHVQVTSQTLYIRFYPAHQRCDESHDHAMSQVYQGF